MKLDSAKFFYQRSKISFSFLLAILGLHLWIIFPYENDVNIGVEKTSHVQVDLHTYLVNETKRMISLRR